LENLEPYRPFIQKKEFKFVGSKALSSTLWLSQTIAMPLDEVVADLWELQRLMRVLPTYTASEDTAEYNGLALELFRLLEYLLRGIRMSHSLVNENDGPLNRYEMLVRFETLKEAIALALSYHLNDGLREVGSLRRCEGSGCNKIFIMTKKNRRYHDSDCELRHRVSRFRSRMKGAEAAQNRRSPL
jgi:hypothetical protein